MNMMNRSIDVRAEMRKIASSKPVYAAAGAGLIASQTLRALPARLAKWRSEATATSLPTRATKYVHQARARAAGEYDKLAARGMRALNGRGTGKGRSALNGKPKTTRQAGPRQ